MASQGRLIREWVRLSVSRPYTISQHGVIQRFNTDTSLHNLIPLALQCADMQQTQPDTANTSAGDPASAAKTIAAVCVKAAGSNTHPITVRHAGSRTMNTRIKLTI